MRSQALKLRASRAGLPPGSLVQTSEKPLTKSSITIINYNADQYSEREGATLHACLPPVPLPDSCSWINICGITDPQIIEEVGKHFELHPLLLEDIMSLEQRSKLDDYKNTIYLIVNMLTYNPVIQQAEDEQVSLVLGKDFVISFLEKENPVFNPIRDRIIQGKNRIRQRSADYLCYALIDSLVDNYFLILEKIDNKLENLENELFNNPIPGTLHTIHHAKLDIIHLRKSVWPMREVLSNFRRSDSPLILDSTKLYIQDVYDHTIQAIDIIEGFRDITSGMLDIYLSSLSQRMNEIMKVLTVVATIFVPLTFIASFYGMNFYIPETHWEWGYPMVVGMMIVVGLCMVAFFRRKKWI